MQRYGGSSLGTRTYTHTHALKMPAGWDCLRSTSSPLMINYPSQIGSVAIHLRMESSTLRVVVTLCSVIYKTFSVPPHASCNTQVRFLRAGVIYDWACADVVLWVQWVASSNRSTRTYGFYIAEKENTHLPQCERCAIGDVTFRGVIRQFNIDLLLQASLPRLQTAYMHFCVWLVPFACFACCRSFLLSPILTRILIHVRLRAHSSSSRNVTACKRQSSATGCTLVTTSYISSRPSWRQII